MQVCVHYGRLIDNCHSGLQNRAQALERITNNRTRTVGKRPKYAYSLSQTYLKSVTSELAEALAQNESLPRPFCHVHIRNL